MAGQAAAGSQDTNTATERKQSTFVVFVQVKGKPETLRVLDARYQGITQDHAKRDAARAIAAIDGDGHALAAYRDAVLDPKVGIEVAAVSERVWQPLHVKVEPQPAKVTFT